MKISIVLPIYNEEASVDETVARIKAILSPLSHEVEILAIDDGSNDGTYEILKRLTGVLVLRHPQNLGYGAAIKSGLRHAVGDWVLIVDVDGSYPLQEIPTLLDHVPGHDMVVGARTGASVHVSPWRKPAKLIIRSLARFLTGRKILDFNSGFRVFSRHRALEFIKLFPSGFSFTTTITLAFLCNDYLVREIPVDYHKRVGRSKIRPFRDFFGFLGLVFRIVMYFRPLRFFLFPGVLMILSGAAYGVYQVMTQPARLAEFPVLVMLLGAITVLMGALADIVAKK